MPRKKVKPPRHRPELRVRLPASQAKWLRDVRRHAKDRGMTLAAFVYHATARFYALETGPQTYTGFNPPAITVTPLVGIPNGFVAPANTGTLFRYPAWSSDAISKPDDGASSLRNPEE